MRVARPAVWDSVSAFSGSIDGRPDGVPLVKHSAVKLVLSLRGAVVHGTLPLVWSRSSHKVVVDLVYEQAELGREWTIKSIRKQSTSCWLPLITLKGEKSFKSGVWLLNQLQLSYKHKLKGFLAAECQQRCLAVYCIRLLSGIIIWSAAQTDESQYDSRASLCDSRTFTNTAAHRVGIIMCSGIFFFYSPLCAHVITFDQIITIGEDTQLNWSLKLRWANSNPVFTAQWDGYQQLW